MKANEIITRIRQACDAKPKPNYEHFEKVIKEIQFFDLVLVCGTQAKETVEKYIEEIRAIGKPILFVPHPAARNLTNVRCEEIRNKIKEYEQGLVERHKDKR